ncbi:P-loop NTPase fold protein [uncultured Alteromonas sp.]|uniref:P-loop NTPase fold protein n=1 Tax=uncultured Alteromonas sp. TaxID=179113 RepID=UPI0030D055F6|tara:strand:- start:38 stop:2884 length:2847 start_codon:yes stop_codon:yes gene_type:complete
MSHLYNVQKEISPEHQVIFTSVDSRGGLGPLSQYVLNNSGIKTILPSEDDLKQGFYISRDKSRTIAFIVTVTSQRLSPAISLQENLTNALNSLHLGNETSIWLPLMATGSGGLSYEKSASILKGVLEEFVVSPLLSIYISLPIEVDSEQEIKIKRIFNPNFEPEPAIPLEIAEKINSFKNEFPISNLANMSLDEYSNINIHNKKYFTYWLEHETSEVGGVRGGSSFKFGIFRRLSKAKKLSTKTHSYTSDYAWYSRYGATKEVAFKTILSYIVRTGHSAAKGQLEEIVKIPLDNRIKWKIAFLYQNFQKPKIVSIYKKEALLDLSGLSESNFNIAKAHEVIISKKPHNKDVWTYSRELWQGWAANKSNTKSDNTIGKKSKENQLHEIDIDSSEIEEDIELDSEVVQITRFDNDTLVGDDQLGLKTEIESLASIIAYKETSPPLSIGIFGEWGSGKSFYMNQLIHRVDSICEIAKSSDLPQRQYPFYKNIKQIKFNAWNYVESDLWASLAHTIYRNLYESQSDTGHNDSHWLGVVKYGEEELKLKEKEIQVLEKKVDAVSSRIDKLSEQENVLNLNKIYLEKQNILSTTINTELAEKCESFLSKIGIDSEVKTINDAVLLSSEINSLRNRTDLFFKAVSQSSGGIFLLLMLVPIIVFSLLLGLTRHYENSSILTTYGSIFAFISSSLFWLKDKVNKVSSWLTEVEKIRFNVTSLKSQKNEELEAQKKENIRSLKETVNQLKQADRDKLELLNEIKKAKYNINQLTPETMLAHHISETIGDNRYGKFLGLPAVLSRDFEMLSETIIKQNLQLEDINIYPTIQEEKNAEDAQHRINRIVLYIDDLDRCEPETVIKVLEAVHLFLASPLFVVVLGVDPRWLFSSIMNHFPTLMKSDKLFSDQLKVSTPEEYLEKIFQIPIWLNTPTNDSVERLISSIIGEVSQNEKRFDDVC